jgi:pimeloyl-ACP methyl ester carboxylesterase
LTHPERSRKLCQSQFSRAADNYALFDLCVLGLTQSGASSLYVASSNAGPQLLGGVAGYHADELQARINREIKAISVPVLAVFGQTIDATTREHLLGHCHRRNRGGGGLGHMVHLMEPDRFAHRLAEFAERCFLTST